MKKNKAKKAIDKEIAKKFKDKNSSPTTVFHTKKETDTPQYTERDRSADARAIQNNQ